MILNRSGWSSKQNSLFDKVIKVLSSLRLARLTYDSVRNEFVFFAKDFFLYKLVF